MNIQTMLKKRRSIYKLGKKLPISQEKLVSTIKEITELVPDAFNMKSSRVVVLCEEKQNLFWDSVYEIFNGQVSKDKINKFRDAYGTILYFYDENVVKTLQEKYPLYAENFPIWANQASGMLQFTIWTALADLGIGANLQHYNPIIDKKIKEIFNLPENYLLIAQMPFGSIEESAEEKEKEDINQRVIIIK